MDGKRKRGTPPKRSRDKDEEDLNIMGIKNSQVINRDRGEWRKTVLQVNVHKGIECLSSSSSSSSSCSSDSSSSSVSSSSSGVSISSSSGSNSLLQSALQPIVVFRPAQLSLSIISRKDLQSAVASGMSNPQLGGEPGI
jgi:hypothetical protein